MRNISKSSVSLAVALIVMTASGLKAATVTADGDTCQPISSAPVTITTSGTYCLTADISYTPATGPAITVSAPHVVLDLSGHTLTNLSAGTGTQAVGVESSFANPANTTVRNGNVIGFDLGIDLGGSGALVEGIRADQNRSVAIKVSGIGSVVRDNLIIHTGNGATIGGVGIDLLADGTRALNNDVVDTAPGSAGIAYGILALSGTGVVVEGNRVSNSGAPSKVNVSIGIQFGTGVKGLAVNNRIAAMTEGLEAANAAYRDNLTIGVLTPYVGPNNAGNNQSF